MQSRQYDALGKWRKRCRRLLRSEVREVLVAEVQKRGIGIMYGKRFVEISGEDAEKARVLFDDGSRVEAYLVVGANGINPPLRKYVAPSSPEPIYSGIMSIFAETGKTVPGVEGIVQDGSINSIVAEGGAFAVTPATGGRDGGISFFATFPAPARIEAECKVLNLDKQALQAIMQGRYLHDPWPENVKALVKQTPKEEYFITAFRHVPELERWHSAKGRVLVAGDAAHAIPPSTGQGGNMSIEDAVSLGFTIGEINRCQGQAQELFTAGAEHRNERIKLVIVRNEIATTIRNGVPREEAENQAGGQLDNLDDKLR